MSQTNKIEPLKSSAEILSELFSSFNAEPPLLNIKSEEKTSKKHKKSKKKHKHKEKKHKKKSKRKRSSDGDSSEDSEEEGTRHKHKSRKKLKEHSSSKDNLYLNKMCIKQEKRSKDVQLKQEDLEPVNKKQPESKHTEKKNVDILMKQEDVKSISIIVDKVSNEKKITNGSFGDNLKRLESKENNDSKTEDNNKDESLDKSGGKITIKSLKNSTVYEATIREVEEKAREIAMRFEDGEITDSESESKYSDEILNEIIISERSSLKQSKKESSRHEKKKKHSEKKIKRDGSKKSKKDKYHHSHRSRSRDKERRSTRSSKDDYYHYRTIHSHRNYSPDRDKYRSIHEKRKSRDRSRSRDHWSSSHWSSERRRRSKSPISSSIDKKKLLEIARKNAINMLKSGTLPDALTLGPQAQEKVIAAIKAGGKTIEELTDFCKNLSRKEALGELSSVSSVEDELDSGSDTEKVFHHPFQIKDKPTSIVMNIKNSTPLPIKTPKEKSAELLMQFPVSSGQLHRKTENEWVPVSPKKIEAPPPVPAPNQVIIPTPVPKPVVISTPVPAQTIAVTPPSDLDIGSIVSQRLNAMRKLQENPNDVQALNQMYRVQKEMQTWAQSKQQPGQFTGSTGAQILTAAELSSGYQAWARKDQLQNAAPVMGGMGMHLLQKMGWRPGEGLGKEKSGQLEPLLLEVKLDKKGLVANEEVKNKRPIKTQKAAAVKTLSGKHPVSLLGEFASKRKLGVPQYELCFECGPDHKKNFLFKVLLNGIEYKPSIASSTKKQAKADSAAICLQQLGILPS